MAAPGAFPFLDRVLQYRESFALDEETSAICAKSIFLWMTGNISEVNIEEAFMASEGRKAF